MDVLVIDGSYGEGGGQILRSSLSLSVITGRPVRLENIRARRKKPGMAAQHLTAVRAAAMLCDARVEGAELGSQILDFIPKHRAKPGVYSLDVAAAREGGSAGAVMLVVQTVLLPLAMAGDTSTVTLHGGTHVPMSPCFDYVHDVWLPTLERFGIRAELTLIRSGWYPVGQGEVCLFCAGDSETNALPPLRIDTPGALQQVTGRAVAANLPAHIPQRMRARAQALLSEPGIRGEIQTDHLKAACPGAGLFLTAHYQHGLAGFSALGARGKPAELVAEEACAALLRHHASGAALEPHLADQLIVPAALAREASAFSVEQITSHLRTNAWVVERFGLAQVAIVPGADGTGQVSISPSPCPSPSGRG